MANHQPRLTDQVGTIDTSGVAPGPHSDLNGVTPVFEIDKERTGVTESTERSVGERFETLAQAAGTEEYQEAHSEGETGGGALVDDSPRSATPYPPSESTLDTSGTDEVAASGEGHETVIGHQTDTPDTSETGGEPNFDLTSDSNAESASSLTDEGLPHTVVAAEERSADEAESRKVYKGIKVADLIRWADRQYPPVQVPEGATKAEIIDALVGAGVRPPADGVVPSAEEFDAQQAEDGGAVAINENTSGDGEPVAQVDVEALTGEGGSDEEPVEPGTIDTTENPNPGASGEYEAEGTPADTEGNEDNGEDGGSEGNEAPDADSNS